MDKRETYHRKKAHKSPIEECHYCITEQWKCRNKTYRFDDRTDAAIELVKVNVQRRAKGAKRLALYECRWCDQWHFTTGRMRGQSNRERDRLRKEMIMRELEKRERERISQGAG